MNVSGWVAHVRRTPSRVNGRPVFDVIFTDRTVARTSPDSDVHLMLDGSILAADDVEGRRVYMTLTDTGGRVERLLYSVQET